MSKKQELKEQKKILSLVHQLENAVLELESAGQNEQDIFSLVNMILKGFIRDGVITEEYRYLAQKAMEARTQNQEPVVIVDTSGQAIN